MPVIEPIRNRVRQLMNSLASGLNKATGGKLSPNFVTVFGLLMHVPIGILIASGEHTFAAILLLVFGLFDALDGALARLQNSTSSTGMLLDSVSDRIKEIIVYVCLAFYFVGVHQANLAILVSLALGVSLLISYLNAWGEAMSTKKSQTNKRFRVGLMSFDIRMLVLIIALATQQLTAALVIISLLGVVTVAERFVLISKRAE